MLFSNFAIAASCRFSCALRIIGSATAPHNLSAMIVDERIISVSFGLRFSGSHVNISGSAIFIIISEMRCNSVINLILCILGEIWGFSESSMFCTRLLETPASPTNLSLAIGGQVDILNMGKTSGCFCRIAGETLFK